MKSIYEDCVKIEKIRKYKAGYILQKETIGRENPIILNVAYNYNGDYIGNSKGAFRLCKKYGIKPEKANSTHSTCSIGFCEKDQKWFGWSHRALDGFGIGHITKEGNCECSSGWIDEYLKKHPEADKRMPVGFKVKNLEDAKKCAIAFAESVS